MRKFTLAAVAAALSTGFIGQANAAIIISDDFDAGPQFAWQGATSSTVANRTLSIEVLSQNSGSFPGNVDPFAQIDPVSPTWGSALIISNGSGDDSKITLSYDLDVNAALADALAIQLDFLDNDTAAGLDNSVEAFINGGSIGTINLADSDAAFSVSFALDAIQAAALAAGGTISFEFNGAPDFDLVLDRVSAVPEPGMIGLFGLGLAGIGFAARRRRAA